MQQDARRPHAHGRRRVRCRPAILRRAHPLVRYPPPESLFAAALRVNRERPASFHSATFRKNRVTKYSPRAAAKVAALRYEGGINAVILMDSDFSLWQRNPPPQSARPA